MIEWNRLSSDVDIKDYQGFVYVIENLVNKKKYIGQKTFWKKIRRKPLKGKTRVRLDKVESDWKKYMGSSQELLEDVKRYGEKNFKKMVLCLCTSKSNLNYMELEYQIKFGALFRDDFYNNILNIRINGNTINKEEIKKLSIR